ncbi:hypothetical protein K0H59_04650 [Shewanella sp. FJAT-51649]|uniref:hypothetical protein n=1 Tax=Shewanella sp. FJAT-51649 TaxID=2864210 RepID=UPI001C6590F9|nr:hypothetical protein [Shewanella sp. FJAT-51649]QYJ72351.1 hypothetical protein K0H59_04650 [Shewanella sp. FJAT-51649]
MKITRFFQSLLFRIKSGGEDIFEIKVNNKSIYLFKNNMAITVIDWDNICSITAFKQDNLTVDPVVLCLCHSPDTKHGTAFNEFMSGFDTLVSEINERYGLECDWLNRVNLGAFKKNLEVLWQRA